MVAWGGTRRALALAVSLTFVAGSALAAVPAGAAPPVEPPGSAPDPSGADGALGTDQLLVTPTGSAAPDTEALGDDAGLPVQAVRRTDGGAWVVKLPRKLPDAAVEALAARWTRRSDVALAEPDRIRTIQRTPNDPEYASQWHYTAPGGTSYGANLPLAWDVTTGASSVTVAVLDTGRLNHVDLVGKYVGGYDFINDSLVGNDGNGRDSDPSDPGDWITAAENASGYFAGCGAGNSSWHGTHVAGTIGASTNNNIGVAGVAWGAKILPVRVLGKCGGYDSDIIDAAKWSAGLTVSGVPANANPAQVINLSLGGGGTCSTAWQTAINSVVAAGTTVVVAAGNSNANVSGSSPGNCANVVTVAATGKTGNRAYYSNYGTLVELAAPGGDSQVSTTVRSTLNTGTTTPVADSYANYQGTSMATPHVAGVAALIKSVRPAATPAQVLGYLQGNVTAFPAGSTCTTSLCGTGILNANAAVRAAASVPGAPGTPTGVPGDGTVTLSWAAASVTGDTAVTGYTVTPSIGGVAQAPRVFNSTATAQAITGLTNGTAYTFTVAATNVIGTGPQSAASAPLTPASPVTVPGAPGTPTATGGVGEATVSWAAPASDGGSPVTGYTVTPHIGGVAQTPQAFDASTTTRTLTGLTSGSSYTFTVAATNAAGTGVASAPSNEVLLATAPSAPGSPTAVAGTGEAKVSWTAPADDGGSPVTGYTVTPHIGGVAQTPQAFDATATTRTLTGLADGSLHTFTVTATNAAGTSPASAASAAVWPHLGLPQVRVADVRVAEDAGVAAVAVSLSKPGNVNVTVSTKGATAAPGSDFTGVASRVVAFTASGPTTQVVTVPVLDDATKELTETFTVSASAGALVATMADGSGIVTLLDDDGLPAAITVDDVPSVIEGGSAVFTVRVQGRVDQGVSVPYATANGAALAGSDYTGVSGTLVFAVGEVDPVRTITVPVTNDAAAEGVEAFSLKLTTRPGLTFADGIGAATIAPSDGGAGTLPAVRRVRVDDVRVDEGAGTAEAVIRIDQSATASVLVTAKSGTAIAGTDFAATSARAEFTAGGPTTVTVSIPLTDDALAEHDETFSLTLSSPIAAGIADSSAVGSLIDDDGGAPQVRISDARVVEGQSAAFLVSVDGPIGHDITVTLSLANGTAVSGSDFGSLSTTTITFTAGSVDPSRVVTVPIVADAVTEATAGEKFTAKVALPAGTVAKLADSAGTGHILD